jgi:hypothetical protein
VSQVLYLELALLIFPKQNSKKRSCFGNNNGSHAVVLRETGSTGTGSPAAWSSEANRYRVIIVCIQQEMLETRECEKGQAIHNLDEKFDKT